MFYRHQKTQQPLPKKCFLFEASPPTSLTDQILAVCLFLMMNSLAQHTRESLSRPAHFNSPHFSAAFTPTATHTHIHKGMVLILFEQLLLKGNTSANIGLQWSRQNWFINEWVCHSVSLRLSYVLKLILVAYRKWFPPFRKFAYSFSFWVLHEMSWFCV